MKGGDRDGGSLFMEKFVKQAVEYSRTHESDNDKLVRLGVQQGWRTNFKMFCIVHQFHAINWTFLPPLIILLTRFFKWLFIGSVMLIPLSVWFALTIYTVHVVIPWLLMITHKITSEACLMYINNTGCPFGIEQHFTNGTELCQTVKEIFSQFGTKILFIQHCKL